MELIEIIINTFNLFRFSIRNFDFVKYFRATEVGYKQKSSGL